MNSSPSLAGRAVVAVLLMIGFYLMAIGIAVLLLGLVYVEIRIGQRILANLTAVCVTASGVILWSIFPRTAKFVPPGPALEPAAHPRLFSLIEDIARATKQRPPEEIYLVPDVNGWVSSVGGTMGFASTRIMGLGLPLLQVLDVSELRAVLAHEFGHYHGGDVALGPWIYTTRAAIGRTLRAMKQHDTAFRGPFEWYGVLFLRLTHAISRAQELAADALAAGVAGAGPLKSGLRKLEGAAPAFRTFWTMELRPIMSAGFRPPIARGFQLFLAADSVSKQVNSIIEQAESSGENTVFDTHPPLRERLAALEGAPEIVGAVESEPAITLLELLPEVEEALVLHLVADPDKAKFVALNWDEVGTRFLAPMWGQVREAHRAALGDIRVGALPEATRDLDAFSRMLPAVPAAATLEDRNAFARWVLGAILGRIFVERGGDPRAMPGEAITVRMPAGDVHPFLWSAELGTAELDPEAWRTRCRQFDVEDVPLAGDGSGSDAAAKPS